MNSSSMPRLVESTATWFLVASHSGARVFESDGGIRNFRCIKIFSGPNGHFQSHKLVMAEAVQGHSNDSSHGLKYSGEATLHQLRVFVGKIADLLEKGREENHYERLVLIAESEFLEGLRKALNKATVDCVVLELDKDIWGESDESIKQRMDEEVF